MQQKFILQTFVCCHFSSRKSLLETLKYFIFYIQNNFFHLMCVCTELHTYAGYIFLKCYQQKNEFVIIEAIFVQKNYIYIDNGTRVIKKTK